MNALRHFPQADCAIFRAGCDYTWPVQENRPRVHKDIVRLFAPNKAKQSFWKIETDFLTAENIIYGHGRSTVNSGT
jgi:hypothetical protein